MFPFLLYHEAIMGTYQFLKMSQFLFSFTPRLLSSPPCNASTPTSGPEILHLTISNQLLGFPGGSVVKNSPANAEDPGSISGLGRSPGEGHGHPLQYSCLEISTEEPGGL